jgi:hypothetical protein
MDFMQRSFTIVILWPATSRSADELDQLGEILAKNLLRQRTVVWRGSFCKKVCHRPIGWSI